MSPPLRVIQVSQGARTRTYDGLRREVRQAIADGVPYEVRARGGHGRLLHRLVKDGFDIRVVSSGNRWWGVPVDQTLTPPYA